MKEVFVLKRLVNGENDFCHTLLEHGILRVFSKYMDARKYMVEKATEEMNQVNGIIFNIQIDNEKAWIDYQTNSGTNVYIAYSIETVEMV